MSSGTVPRSVVTAALLGEWAALDTLLSGLPEPAWSLPSALPGWSVHDIVAHIIGTEAWLTGEPGPPSDIDITALLQERHDITGFNQRWVDALRMTEPPALLRMLRDVTSKRATQLQAMTQTGFDAITWTPAGQAPYSRFMRIRVFDCWLHEQDIRDVVNRPGHEAGPAAELSLDEITHALGYIVGKQASAPQGASVTIQLTGPVHRTIHVQVDGRAKVVPQLAQPATTTLRLPSGLFARLAAGRLDPGKHLGDVTIHGDASLGHRIITNLAFTI